MRRQIGQRVFVVALAIIAATLLALPTTLAQTEGEDGYFPTTLVSARGGDVSGIVVDKWGRTIAGAHVKVQSFVSGDSKALFTGNREWDLIRARSQSIKQVSSTRTDAAGKFRIEAEDTLKPSLVYVFHPEYAVSLIRIERLDDMKVTLAKGITTTGRVLDESGSPLANVQVKATGGWLESFEGADHGHEAVTDEDGRFELPHCRFDQVFRPQLKLQHRGFVDTKIPWFPDKATADKFGKNMPPGEFQIGDFECRMERAATVKLIGIDDENGEEVPLDFFNLFPIDKALIQYRIEAEREDFRFEIKRGQYKLYCVPKPETGLLGKLVAVDLDGPDLIEQKIHFSKGCPVEGRVIDQKTGDVVASVPVAWLPNAGRDALKDDNQFYSFVRTDDFGRFAMVVPPGKGKLLVGGRVPGYVTVAADFEGDLPTHVEAVYARKFDLVAGESRDDITIELPPSRVIHGKVVDQTGKAASSIAYFGSYFHSGYSAYPDNRGMTDESGNFTITEMFDDACLNYGDDQIARVAVIDCENNLSKLAEVGSHDRVGDPIELSVALEPAASLTGTVFDTETDQPIANVPVTATLHGIPNPADTFPTDMGIEWKTRTNARGEYQLRGLLPGVPVRIKAEKQHYGLLVESKRFTDVTPQIPGEEVDPYDIALKLPALVVDKPKFRVEEMEPDKAVEQISKYFRTQMGKLEDSTMMSSSSSRDPDNQFRNQLLVAAGPLVAACRKLDLTPEQEAAMYVGILDPISANSGTWIPSREIWLNQAMERLCTTLIDEDDVLVKLKQFVEYGVYSEYFPKIIEHTSKPQARGWASFELAVARLDWLLHAGARMQDKQFDETLEYVDKLTGECLDELAKQPLRGLTVGERMRHRLKYLPGEAD